MNKSITGEENGLRYYLDLKDKIRPGEFNGVSTKEALLKAASMSLPLLVDLAMLVRRKRIAAGIKTETCASGYLPHHNGKGCEMNCSFCGFPQRIYEKGTRQFVGKLSEDAIIEDAKKKKKHIYSFCCR